MTAYTDVTNKQRASWAAGALMVFMQETGCDLEDSLGDLLCDLMHWAAQNNFDFDLALSRAKGHFDEERDDEEMAALLAATPALAEALLDIKRMASKHDDSGCDPYAVLELIEQKAIAVLAQAKGGAQ
jgi:hypothetical protein